MTRAAWFFCRTTITPGLVEPDWPGGSQPAGLYVGGRYDCRVLQAGAPPADHVHFVRGTRADDNYQLFDAGDRHYHVIQWYDGAWRQITFRGTEHDHPFSQQGVRFLPDYMFLFAAGADATIAALDGDANWAIAGEVVNVTGGTPSEWVPADDVDDDPGNFNATQWATRLRVAFGIELPSQVTTQHRLVHWFGPMCVPTMYDWWDDRRFR